MQGYIPSTEGEQMTWLENFKSKIDTFGSTVGLSPDKILEVKVAATLINDKLIAVSKSQADYQMAVQEKESAKKTGFDLIRAVVADIKTDANYTEAIGNTLGIVSTPTATPEKPGISVEVVPQGIAIKFTKNGFEGVNIYRMKKGDADFAFVRHATRSPFIDTTVAKGIAAVYEYMVVGLIADEETGKPSDNVAVVFGG